MCKAKYFFITLFCITLIACSLVKTGYNNASTLTIWWLDDYFGFSPAQQATLKPSLQKLHKWHRQTQLPDYISLLQSTQIGMAKDQISADEVCATFDAVKSKIHLLQVESIPIILEFAPTISDKQLQRFQNKLVERAQKWKKEWWQESQAERLNARFEKAEDIAEDMYGDLSDAQLNQLEHSVTQANINPAISYAEIERRNDDAFAILKTLQNQTLSIDEKTQLVKAGFARIQASPDATYETYADAQTKHACQTMAILHASTTPKQKLHAKKWLEDYIVQIAALQTK